MQLMKPINIAVGKIVDQFPNNMTMKKDSHINLIERMGKFSTPANRLFMGATALALQPMIDLNNKDVDEKTRQISCARTIAKIIAGTSTGVFIRWACIKSIDSLTKTPEQLKEMTKNNKKITKWNTALIPTTLESGQFGKTMRLVKNHRNAIGSIVALGVMLFTNFALDVPITKFLTNIFVDKFVKSEPNDTIAKGGN